MTIYVALHTAFQYELVTLSVQADEHANPIGQVVAVVGCRRVDKDDIVEIDDLPFDASSFASSVLKIPYRVVRAVKKNE